MKSYFKKAFTIFLVLIIISTLTLSAFATNNGYNRGYGYSTNVYKYRVTLVGEKGSEKITFVNTCGTPFNVYFGSSIYRVNGYSEKTVAYSIATSTKNKKYTRNITVTVQPCKTGTHSFRIKTTGYNDTIAKLA